MFLRRYIKHLHYFQNSLRQWPTRIANAHMAYQFKIEPQAYYPNRKDEMQQRSINKVNEQMKLVPNQLVAEKSESKRLPRDYYYRILGVGKHANMHEIKQAYYALAKRFHPDTNNSASENKRFQEISNAYAILTDETKRLEYDQLGKVMDEQNFLTKFVSIRSQPTMNIHGLNDVARPQTPDELMYMTNSFMRMELTFLEAAHGCKKGLNLSYLNKCPVCHGRAPKLATRNKQETCAKCEGTGKVTKRTPTFTAVVVCDSCGGKRYISRNHCDNCDSRGMVVQQTSVTVIVPPGTRHGDVISLENPNTKQCVSYRVHVQESDLYKRKDNDVHTEQYISISNAVLGGIIEVRGIYEDITLTVAPGTESHTDVRITGKGIKTREGCGDHVVLLKIRIPKDLTMKQRQLLQALAKTENIPDN